MNARGWSLSAAILLLACKGASKPDAVDAATASAKDTAEPVVDVGDLTEFLVEAGGEGGAGSSSGSSASSASNGSSASAAGSASEAPTGASSGSGAGAGGPSATAAPSDPHPTEGGAPAGNVKIFAITANGGVTADKLGALLEKQKNRYRGCYGKALAANPSTGGTLKLRISIDADGKIEDASVVGGTLGLSPLVQCSVAVTKSLKLTPKPGAASKGGFDLEFSKS